MEWIKASEQLPEMEVPVLAGWFSEYGGKFVWHCFLRSDPDGEGWIWYISTDNFLSDENWFIQDDDYPITHWAPMPQPPEE
ncbi:DUF551 domain-containing protein [Morganella morganii]